MRIVIDLQGAQSASRFRGIGRYSLALAQGVARNAGSHEVWLVMNGALAESIPALRRAFSALVPPQRMRVFDIATPAAELHPADGWRARADERIREYAIDQLRPDVVLVTSLFEGFVDDAVCSVGAFTDGASHAVVLYDLIPFLNPAAYLGSDAQRRYYERKIASLRQAGLLLAISDYSRREAIDALGLDPERVVSISTAVDQRFAPAAPDTAQLAALRERFGITREFIMYAPGGFDKRKNIDGLVSAYSRLAPALRGAHQLLIASKLQAGERDELVRHSERCGLRADELVLTDYVDDDTLMALYRACALFVFPSLHEGFGLPALEAMACGALVIGGNNTSLPEVIGSPEAMFDAADPDAIAARIGAVLTGPELRARLRENGRTQAAKFSWDRSAQRALAALERHAARPKAPAAPRGKRRLAFVSPLPPERTGIADYAAQCLPALRHYFDITLIVQQSAVTLPDSLADLARHDAAWLAEHAASFDQILYQFGNSPFHSHMFGLLERFPGVVVLHDFYLSSVLAYEQMTGAMPRAWIDALYRSHGYGAVRDALAPGGAEAATLAYPCNLEVLQRADAVIVHSGHALELACQWYGPEAGADWHVVPLPRSAPAGLARAEARAALGIRADALLVCSFGFVDARKLSHLLLQAWRDSSLCADQDCELVFVGANHGGAYGKELLDAIGAARAGERIRIAGWTEDAQYHRYLQAADICVQLRAESRGETSAAVLDCMNYGLATIVNANGSMAELPGEAVWKLADDFPLKRLIEALETLRRDPAARSALGARAAAAIATGHRPEHSAAGYAEVLDAVARRQPRSMRALSERIGAALPDDDTAFQQMAYCLSLAPHALPQSRQLLVDVTNIVRQDLGTGIERVVRMQLLELLNQSGEVRVEPVYLSQQGGRSHYRYAQQYACRLLGIEPVTHADEAIDIRPGDLFYAPDYAPAATLEAAAAGIYASWRARGVSLTFLIHDLLPVLQPEFFPPGAAANHAAWLACIGANADRLLCISQAVADETRTWMAGRSDAAVAVLHHGADLGTAADAGAPPQQASEVLAQLREAPSFLMVGTIEPRKGHLQALDAFEQLWRDGVDARLVIVGHEGWKPLADSERRTIPLIVRRLQQHPELGRRLFWLKGIDDACLQHVYQGSACLLAASEGEGFGLPLIEAARYGLPVIARDIPVFREVAQEGAWYFSGSDGAALAASVRQWLDRHATGTHPASSLVPQRSWRDNAAQLLRILSGAG